MGECDDGAMNRRPRLLFAIATLWLLGLHMMLLASSLPLVRHLRVHARAWPAGTAPMRLVLLSDLHVATPGDSPAHLAHVVARVNALAPDLVLIAGDFLSTGELLAEAPHVRGSTAPLAGLRARLGTIAVLGNHDYGAGRAPRVAAALRREGITLLDNDAVRRGPLAIVGVSDANTNHDRVPEAIDRARTVGGLAVMLTHSPDAIPKLPAGVDLALAGHTHCGQVTLPWIGAVTTGSHWGQRYACGIVHEGDRTAVITAGLGTSNLPIRLGAAPDMWVIDIGR
jgi:predicted MPP superfamily phosphohydrolase